MKSYCLKCRKNTENINPKVSKRNNGRALLLSNCAICGSKKSRFIKNQEAKGLLSNLVIKTPLNKVPSIVIVKGVVLLIVIIIIIMRLKKIYSLLKDYTKQLLENLNKEKFILDLKIIFGELV